MCTVSFIAIPDAVVISSNRDEHVGRERAHAPVMEMLNNKQIIFPKDAKAGGTWFAAADDGTVAVLLNGAFEKHVPMPPYRRSRGLVLLDIISAVDPFSFTREMSLENIEPFTVILYCLGSLQELRWDGKEKHETTLSSSADHIWSSATLYAPEARAFRKELFEHFLAGKKMITPADIHDFHSNDQQDSENGFVIDRNTGLKTFSITQAIIKKDRIVFMHEDLLQKQRTEQTLQTSHALINQ